jgi:hypothetical protein
MSAEEPTHPEGYAPKVRPGESWDELEGRTGAKTFDIEKSTPSQTEAKGHEDKEPKHVLSRRVRLLLAGVSAVLVVALASIAVTMSVGGDHVGRIQLRSGAVHARGQEGEKRRSGRARRVTGAGKSPRRRQGRSVPGRPHARRHGRPRHNSRRPAQQPADTPAQPPESTPTSPEPAPGAPAPAAPSEPQQGPGLRDGATESTEFGL